MGIRQMLSSENGTYSGSAPEGEAYYRFDIKQAEVVTMTFEAYQRNEARILNYIIRRRFRCHRITSTQYHNNCQK